MSVTTVYNPQEEITKLKQLIRELEGRIQDLEDAGDYWKKTDGSHGDVG